MAYRFVSGNRLDFANTPFLGYTFGPVTIALLIKLNGTVNENPFVAITNSARATARVGCRSFGAAGQPRLTLDNVANTVSLVSYTTGVWMLTAFTWGGGGTQPDAHINTGSGWGHHAFPAVVASNGSTAVQASDFLTVGEYTSTLHPASDIVCVGIKRAVMSSAQVEAAMSFTSWATWLAAGYDWLAGFEAAGTILDQGGTGAGDEIARVGTTLVADPPGWVWSPTDTTAPSVPTGLTATPDYSTAADLAWTASTDAVGVTGYRVERKTGASAFAEIAAPAGTTYHDTGLAPSTAYVYRVRARDAAGNLSGYSSEVTMTTLWYPDPATTKWVPLFMPSP